MAKYRNVNPGNTIRSQRRCDDANLVAALLVDGLVFLEGRKEGNVTTKQRHQAFWCLEDGSSILGREGDSVTAMAVIR